MDNSDSFKDGSSELNNHSTLTVGKFILALSDQFKFKFSLTVGANDGPLLRFYLKSASAVWDYILSKNSIKKFSPFSVILGSLFTKYTNGLLQTVTEVPTSTLA